MLGVLLRQEFQTLARALHKLLPESHLHRRQALLPLQLDLRTGRPLNISMFQKARELRVVLRAAQTKELEI